MAGAAPQAQPGSLLWLQGLACGALLAFATPVALLAAAALAPAAIAAAAELEPGRPTARAVALGCAAFFVTPAWHLWLRGGGVGDALALLAQPATLARPWLGGAVLWALCEVLPVVLRLGFERAARHRETALIAELAACRAAWDLADVAEIGAEKSSAA